MTKVTSFPDVFRILPRNNNDFVGGMVLFSLENNTFYQFDFGSGDNLDHEDMENGFDDYMMYSSYKWDGKTALLEIFRELKNGEDLDSVDGLEEIDGGMMLIRRSDYSNSGDIRMYIENVLDMAGYGLVMDENVKTEEDFKNRFYKDLLFVCARD